MRLIPGVVAALAVPFLSSCSEITEPDEVGSVLLEIEVVNYAWFPTFYGFVVQADGDVFRYDRKGEQWQQQEFYSPDELNAKFSPGRTLVASRPVAEVTEVASKITSLPADRLSQPQARCADAGTLTYRAYKYNAQAARYVPVLLRAQGDWAQQNTSSVAQELIDYVRSLNLQTEFPGCDP